MIQKELIRLVISGSVDDGKSTLLGRLLYETNSVYKDQLSAVKNESQKYGTQGSDDDLALLIDGLQDEREQGITIDVAYRYFQTSNKKFIIADTPGHKQYTRNMATAASVSEVAIILVDITKGISDQTRLHAFIASIFKLQKVIVLINKIDLVNFNKKKFNLLKKNFKKYLDNLSFLDIEFIPVSAKNGDNVVKKSKKTKWYKGRSFLETLNNIKLNKNLNENLRLPIQWVNRSSTFRGYSGTITNGVLKKNDEIIIEPSKKKAFIKKIFFLNTEVKSAFCGQSVTISFKDQIDVIRGDCVSSINNSIKSYNLVEAKILWLVKNNLILKKNYKIQFLTSETQGFISTIKYKYNLKTFKKNKAKILEENQIGLCEIRLLKKIPMELYKFNKKLGSFIIIDIHSNEICGAGIIENFNQSEKNLFWQESEINKNIRAKLNLQKPCILWFTGLSASGKSTISNIVEKKLYDLNKKTYLLDGDNIRLGLNKDLTFSDQHRKENIRRIGELSKIMVDAGLIVLTAFISPFTSDRFMARNLVEKGEFIEIFVKASLKVCEKRDPKGLYKKVRLGKIKNFTGISSKYEKPKNPELVLDTEKYSPETLSIKVMDFLKKKKII